MAITFEVTGEVEFVDLLAWSAGTFIIDDNTIASRPGTIPIEGTADPDDNG